MIQDFLRRGDILMRRGTYEYSIVLGKNKNTSEGLMPIITKRYSSISSLIKEDIDLDKLFDNYRLLKDVRYSDVADMAEFIYDKDLDAGFDYALSNSEQFVNFCLTRNNYYAACRSGSITGAARETLRSAHTLVSGLFKTIISPVWQSDSLSDDWAKSGIPFGFDCKKILEGSKIFIGHSVIKSSMVKAWYYF